MKQISVASQLPDIEFEKPAIEFVEEPYSEAEAQKMIKQFREEGYVILPDVFKSETIDPFLEQVEALTYHDGLQWRLRDDSPHYLACAKNAENHSAFTGPVIPVGCQTPCLYAQHHGIYSKGNRPQYYSGLAQRPGAGRDAR